ncbi:MAG: hypothetical protein GQ531_01520, partial [Sulfurovum sp.]|nr:hypothetical protein [Sulfurovum sp.]
YENIVIALGGDYSPENRDKYYYSDNEGDHAYSVILKSVDGGKNWKKVEFQDISPGNKVLFFDNQKIIILSEIGNYLAVSFNEGESWSYNDLVRP